MDRDPGPLVVPPGGRRAPVDPGSLTDPDDAAPFEVALVTLAPGEHGPPVVGRDDESAFYILSGELRMEASNRAFGAGEGTFVLIPPGVRHSFSNPTREATSFLEIRGPDDIP